VSTVLHIAFFTLHNYCGYYFLFLSESKLQTRAIYKLNQFKTRLITIWLCMWSHFSCYVFHHVSNKS